MSSLQWTIPIALGLVAAGITWYTPDVELPQPEPLQVRTDSPYVLLPWNTTDHKGTLLRYNVSSPGVLEIHEGHMANGTFWRTGCTSCPEAIHGARSRPLHVDPREHATFGPEYPAARLTLYMFANSGHLLATNAVEWEVYDVHRDFSAFSERDWYFGEGEPPAGSVQVSYLRREAYEALAGTPVGGVQSVLLEEHRYDWIIGPVWLTARVEGLIPDPRAG